MKNIHLIPTDKPSRLHLAYNKDYYLSVEPFIQLDTKNYKSFNIYITSDEKFTSSQDWFIDIKDNRNHVHQIGYDLESIEWNDQYNPLYFKKVILTDNKDLIEDGVQAITNTFLEWFVKNPSCEEVKIESLQTKGEWDLDYKIIIPKEKPKQETLEEAAESYANKKGDIPTTKLEDAIFKQGFIDGAKWMQERMYSEEEVLEIVSNCDGSILQAKKWFEQFKKQ